MKRKLVPLRCSYCGKVIPSVWMTPEAFRENRLKNPTGKIYCGDACAGAARVQSLLQSRR